MKNQNWWLWGAGLLSLILTTVVIEVPFLAEAFELAHLDLMEYGIAFGLAILIIPIVEIVKIIHRAVDKKHDQQRLIVLYVNNQFFCIARNITRAVLLTKQELWIRR
jgi:hypothetical protein